MWVPPTQGFTPATQMTPRQAIQNSIRQQIQREEWMRFHAPPPEDNVYFHDQSSYYEGSPMNIPNRGNMIYQGQPIQNQQDPPIPRVIHSNPVMTSPIPSPHAFTMGPNATVPTFRSDAHQIPNNDIASAKDEHVIDYAVYVTCINTLFGTSFGSQLHKTRTRKTSDAGCNHLNVSTNNKNQTDGYSGVSPRTPGNGNSIACNGVRGPGKKFDYSPGKEPNQFESQRSSRSAFSEFSDKEKRSCLKTESNIVHSTDALKVSAIQIPPDRSEYQGNVHRSVSSNSLREKGFVPIVPSHDKKRTELRSPEVTVSHCDSYEEQSYLVDSLSVIKNKIPADMSMLNGKGAKKNTEFSNCEKSSVASAAENCIREKVDARTTEKSSGKSEVTSLPTEPADGEDTAVEVFRQLGVSSMPSQPTFGKAAAVEIGCQLAVSSMRTKSADGKETALEICGQQEVDESRSEGIVCESVIKEGIREACTDQSVQNVCSEESCYDGCTEQSVVELYADERVHEKRTEQSVNKICSEGSNSHVNDCTIDAYPSFDEPAESRRVCKVNTNNSNITFSLTATSSNEENKQMDANLSQRTKQMVPLTKPATIRQNEVPSTETRIGQNAKIMLSAHSSSLADQ